MRETCVRVLAAALMVGAIATVVGMSALVDTPREALRPIAAPPSAVVRSVPLTARVAPRPRRSSERIVTMHTSYRPPTPSVAPPKLIAVHTRARSQRPQRRQLAAVAAPAPAPAPAPADTSPPTDPAPVVPGTSDGPGRHGRGHAYGRDRQDD